MEFHLDTQYPSSMPYYWPFEDDFNRADSSSPGSTPSGGALWRVEAQKSDGAAWGASIIDGQLSVSRGSAPSTAVNGFAVVDLGMDAALIEVDVNTLPGSNRPLVVGRYVDPNNYIAAYVDGSGNWALVARVNGEGGSGRVLPGSIAAAPGQRIRVQYRSDRVWLYVNGVNSIPSTAFNYHVGATRAGVGIIGDASNWGTASRFDNFRARAI